MKSFTRVRCLSFVALIGALALTGCSGVHTMLTGEVFTTPPEGSERVEAELLLEMDDEFFRDIADPDDVAELRRDVSNLVLSRADLGLRFYPILSVDYGPSDVRPPYLVRVNLVDLRVLVETKTSKSKELGTVSRDFVKGVACNARTSVERRRPDGPPLVVGDERGDAVVTARWDAADSFDEGYVVRRNAGQDPLEVGREDLLRAIDKATIEALRGTIKAVDRELNDVDG